MQILGLLATSTLTIVVVALIVLVVIAVVGFFFLAEARGNMHVLDHEPNSWFLLESDGELVLDVNCSHSFISYSFAIVLNAAERDRFEVDSHDYITSLAGEIKDSVPLVVESKSPFTSRNVHDRYGKQISDAVAKWRDDNVS